MSNYPQPMVTISLEEYNSLLENKKQNEKEFKDSELGLCKEVIALFMRKGRGLGSFDLSPVYSELTKMGIEIATKDYDGRTLLNGSNISVTKVQNH